MKARLCTETVILVTILSHLPSPAAAQAVERPSTQPATTKEVEAALRAVQDPLGGAEPETVARVISARYKRGANSALIDCVLRDASGSSRPAWTAVLAL